MESFNYRYDKTYDSGTVDILQLLDLHNYVFDMAILFYYRHCPYNCGQLVALH